MRDPTDIPPPGPREQAEQTHVVDVQVCVDAACEQAGLELEAAHEAVNDRTHPKRLLFVDGGSCGAIGGHYGR